MLSFVSRHSRHGQGVSALALSITASFGLSAGASAQTTTPLAPITVEARPDMTCPLEGGDVDKREIDAKRILGASDTAALLAGQPGVSLATGGGISSLPIIHGLADDRIKTVVDGMPITSSCPNHMNPALSYIAPANSGHLSEVAGITPVSAGGDSIGGSITADPPRPLFAEPGEGYAAHGTATTFFRSNNRQIGANGAVTAATENISLGYDGSWTRAREAHDGNGDRIFNSQFETQSHTATLAFSNDGHELTIRGGHQLTPYEGFPNAYMDLTGNTSNYLNAGYSGDYGWGKIDAKVYWQNARHEMDFLAGRNITGHMPMKTNGTDAGYSLKAELPVSPDDTLRVGNEYHSYRLSDWWPPVDMMMMGPDTFININAGSRQQIGSFAEWEHTWDARWTSLLGVRNDVIMMNTGNVAGYNAMMSNYATDAAAFNAQNHKKTDVNYDLTATARYEATPINTEEFGFARKTRSPNLYERYAWSTGGMAASMVGWFGNGAEYVGNLNLKPEIANTISASAGLHDAAKSDWAIKATPYYTYVQDYIGVDKLGTSSTPGVYLLRFANHDSQLYGFDLSGSKSLLKSSDAGQLDVSGTAGWVKGMQMNNGQRLYRMQPLNALIGLTHRLDGWTSTAELKLVNDKSVTNPLQNEQTTPGFAIVNLRTSYRYGNVTIAVGIDNLFNKQYDDPNGGAYVSYWQATDTSAAMGALPAAGRSYNAGLSVSF